MAARPTRGQLPRAAWYPAGHAGVHERLFELAGGERARIVEAGAEGAPIVLLLHGWACSAYSWHRVIPLLAGAGFRVIAPDLRGHGGSDKPGDPAAYRLEAMHGWLASLLRAAGIPRLDLAAGHSMGNPILAALAVDQPALVPRLAMVAPVRVVRVPLQRAAALATPPVLTGVLPRLVPSLVARIALHIVTGGGGAGVTDEQVAQYWAPSVDPGFVRALRHLLHEFPWAPMDDDALRRLPRSTTVVMGAGDRLVDVARASRRLAAVRPDVPVRVVPRAGHIVAEQDPEAVAEAIRTLLARPAA
jgi:pimeloyl-ACP methyl ester carboxylesterase